MTLSCLFLHTDPVQHACIHCRRSAGPQEPHRCKREALPIGRQASWAKVKMLTDKESLEELLWKGSEDDCCCSLRLESLSNCVAYTLLPGQALIGLPGQAFLAGFRTLTENSLPRLPRYWACKLHIKIQRRNSAVNRPSPVASQAHSKSPSAVLERRF